MKIFVFLLLGVLGILGVQSEVVPVNLLQLCNGLEQCKLPEAERPHKPNCDLFDQFCVNRRPGCDIECKKSLPPTCKWACPN